MSQVASVLHKLRMLQANAKGMTMKEIAKELKKGIDATREIVQKAVACGLCRCVGRRSVHRVDGQINQVPVYKFGKC